MNASHVASVLLWVTVVSTAACAGPERVQRVDEEPSAEAPPAEVSERARRPLELYLEGVEDPARGTTVLIATIRLAAGLIAPPVVHLELPPGAELVRGYVEEVLSAPGREVTYRREYVVRGARGPIRIRVQSFGVAGGTRVEACWPSTEPVE
jgi:hypothetical protein